MPDSLRELHAWRRLDWHVGELRDFALRTAFHDDPSRGERLTLDAAGIHYDFSKHLVTDDTLHLLRRLAAERGLEERVRSMFRGERVNASEGRPALHVALRMPASRSLVVDGADVVREVHAELDRMSAFVQRVRSGEHVGATGERIRAVVNIGIGGSDLGPAMAYEALRHHTTEDLAFRFVANVDPVDLAQATRGLDPSSTLFVVVSKTMSTLETLENAAAARAWVRAAVGDDGLDRHFAGVVAKPERAVELGIAPELVFRIWDWVGGRTSMCSAVGLSTMLALGPDGFRDLLAGFHAMDEHFAHSALGASLPATHGLLVVWYRGFLGAQTTAVFPYSSALRLLPAYLQQLTMESLGKRVQETGEPVETDTGAVLWGEPGTIAQHAVFQLLHQGTVLVPVDLVGVARSPEGDSERHDLLAANLLAQAQALAFGRTKEDVEEAGVPGDTVPHRVMPGNRPSSALLLRELSPASLGALVALYEHSVFTQAAIWRIDPFDQWGVELGKELAGKIAPELAADWKHELLHDSSTNALIRRYRELRDRRPG